MKPWYAEIQEKCPLLYRKPIYFECGKGWKKIILDLSLEIEQILRIYYIEKEFTDSEYYFEIYAEQVKEKYGRLRFYLNYETKKLSELISETEALSTQTCENCGEFAKMRGCSYIMTLCDKCYKISDPSA